MAPRVSIDAMARGGRASATAMARRARTAAIDAIALAAIVVASSAAADEHPAIRRVDPSLADTLLVCRLLTSGLPDEPSVESIQSGAPAAVIFTLQLMDGERVVSERRIECRMVLDLWEDFFRVQTGAEEVRLADLPALRRHFADLEGLPVALRRSLEDGRRYRVRVRADSHPVAPQEEARIREWVAGSAESGEGGEGREVFIGLGSLIRFFFGGGARRGSAEGVSRWFTLGELNLEAH